MFPLQEPSRWINLVVSLNEYMKYHNFLLKVIPITADIFVFLFPILLVTLYIIWLCKKSDKIKESALRVFWSAIITSIINICIQFFFTKSRPTMMLFWHEEETMLHKFLPNSSFPSDHAAMSMWFAMWLLIRWIRQKDKNYILIGIVFLIFSLIMGFSRIMVWVHRPTDILWGFAVWIIVPLILSSNRIYRLLKKIFITPIISFQKRIRKLFWVKY
jgi:membrane-associated phospholipid phosphatase